MAYKNLEKFERETINCSNCGQCVKGPVDPFRPNPIFTEYMPIKICPMHENRGMLTYSANGMNAMGRAILEGKLEVTPDVVEAFYQCSLCGHCETNCGEVFHWIHTFLGKDIGEAIKTTDVVKSARADFVAMGCELPERVRKVTDPISKSHNRFGIDQAKKRDWLPGGITPTEGAEVLFFVGCIGSFRNREIARSFVRILDKAGIPFNILGEEEWCCGGPQLLNAGCVDLYQEHARHNVEAIRRSGAKKVVCTCADCYRTLKMDYPAVVGDLGFEVLHSAEYFANLLDEGKLVLDHPVNETITFQDPCQLARAAKVTEEPRKVLAAIPGLELKEMQGNKEYTMCCGHYPVELPESTALAGKNRLEAAAETGVSTLVTACSFCKWSLTDAVKKAENDYTVLDLTEIVAKAMGL
mgnify:FL=1